MNCLLLLVFISLLTIIKGAYNPIPIGSVIISTINKIFVMQPNEYGGNDRLLTIFTATTNMTIVNTIYDPTLRNLYILFTNEANGTIYLCQLIANEKLDSTIYSLPITFDISKLNKLTSFSSDVNNRRSFLTYQTGNVVLFSMSGLMQIQLSIPTTITNPVRSVAYANSLDRLFIITNSTIDSCINLNTNNLQCCQAPLKFDQIRSITFDYGSGNINVYILDQTTGIYSVVLNSAGCPRSVDSVNTLGTYSNIQFVIDRGLYFASGSSPNQNDNSILIIANGTQTSRNIPIGTTIVALHISYPSMTSTSYTKETCFHGITYSDYRIAVILAAVFGTVMGIFMCFNALFCIDFFMTKSIIRNLKKQIPHNLLEDRWNKLVEEKYAKIALDRQRQHDNPPPARRKSSIFDRKTSTVMPSSSGVTTTSTRGRELNTSGDEPSSGSTRKPRILQNLRRMSDNYFTRRRSADYPTDQGPSRFEFTAAQLRTPRTPIQSGQNYIESVAEEDEKQDQKGLRQNLSGQQLIKLDEDFL
ncbi:unnamed protein product [Rotaria sordida]|uniref:Transmembrane protein n=1 Tax=Rotaria sordida TaxID=392033 RepID=A0A819ANQ1_9BILA|nr:unnamed protein product [Rotaria sordida]CAF3790532.1 unnamed protein product [Rotaria sordida]